MIFGLVFSSPFVCQYDLKRFAIKENGNPDKRQFRDGRKEKKERKKWQFVGYELDLSCFYKSFFCIKNK